MNCFPTIYVPVEHPGNWCWLGPIHSGCSRFYGGGGEGSLTCTSPKGGSVQTLLEDIWVLNRQHELSSSQSIPFGLVSSSADRPGVPLI